MVLGQQEQSDKLIEEFGRQILVPGIDEAGQINISKKMTITFYFKYLFWLDTEYDKTYKLVF